MKVKQARRVVLKLKSVDKEMLQTAARREGVSMAVKVRRLILADLARCGRAAAGAFPQVAKMLLVVAWMA